MKEKKTKTREITEKETNIIEEMQNNVSKNQVKITKKFKQQEQTRGVTLVALVVTIVVLLILAGVSLAMLSGDNGLITQAQNASEEWKIAQAEEQLELAKQTEIAKGKGFINMDDYFERLENEGIVNDKDADIVDNGDGTYDVTTDEGYTFEIVPVPDEENPEDIEIEYVGKGEIVGPRISKINITEKTETSISIEVVTRNAEGGQYTYSYKKATESNYIADQITNSTYTFTNLEENTEYDIKVKVETSEGSIEKTIKVTTKAEEIEEPDPPEEETPEGIITFGTATWSNEQASIQVSTTSGYGMEYQINGTAEGRWTQIQNNGIIQNLTHDMTVNVRLVNGSKRGEIQSTKILDETAPKVTVTQQGSATTNTITVNVQAIDNESGMADNATYTYYIKKTTEENYTQKTSNQTNSYTYEELEQETSYDIKVEVQGDKAGNKGEGTLTNVTTGKVTDGTVEGAITFGETTWSEGQASVTISTNTSYKIEYQLNGTEGRWTEIANNGTIQNLAHNTTIYARLTDGNNHGDYTSTNIKDTVKPTVTVTKGEVKTNTITVTVKATDNESGMNTSLTYTYYIKKTTEQNYTQKVSNASNSYTYEGLEQETSYDIKVEVQGDKAGNKGEGTLTNVETEKVTSGLEQGAITFSNPTWNNGQICITINTNTSFLIEWQKNEVREGNWKLIDKGEVITGLKDGDTVYARLTDGKNYGEYSSIDIIVKTIEEMQTEDTNPYLPGSDFNIVLGTDLEKGLVVSDGTNYWTWVEVPKTAVFETATSDKDYENIEYDLIDYVEAFREEGFVDEWYDGDGKKESETQNKNDTTGCGLTASEYKELKKKMLSSIYKNGGFWIGQYEAGSDGVVRKDENVELTIPVIKEGAYPYTNITCSNAQILSSKINSGNYTSSLIFGIQWDLTLKYLQEKGEMKIDELITDSGCWTWGNYSTVSFNVHRGEYSDDGNVSFNIVPEEGYVKPSSKTILLTTGASDRNKRMNIYDLAGNASEWNLECTDIGDVAPCVDRSPSYRSVLWRGRCGTDYYDWDITFRSTLY